MVTRALLVAGLLAPFSPVRAGEGSAERILGGKPAATCQFPTAVAISPGLGTLCTAALVHPRAILTAAHCIGAPTAVRFGEQSTSPARTIGLDWCVRNPDYTGKVGATDYATCMLSEPVEGIPATPVALGCETELLVGGQEAFIVGFGQAEEDAGASTKRWAETTIAADAEGGRVVVGGAGKSSCYGDSGGPAYLRLWDGTWRVFGVVSGGPSCKDGGIYVTAHSTVAFMEEMTNLDVTPCHDVDGAWDPSPACAAFATDPLAPGATWDGWCAGAVSGSGQTCGPAFDAPFDDAPPTVTITSPADGALFPGAPAAIDVQVAADDGEGWGVVEVELVVDGMAAASDDAAPWGFSVQGVEAGKHELVARARDFWGNAGDSPPVAIAVEPDEAATDDGPAEAETDAGPGSSDEGAGETEAGSEGDDGRPLADPAAGGCACAAEPRGRFGALLFAAAAARRRKRR